MAIDQHGDKKPGASGGARRATGDDPGMIGKGSQRFSARRKAGVVLRLLRGESLELLSREVGITAARLSSWREQFLQSRQAALKKPIHNGRDLEIARLQQKLGEVTMEERATPEENREIGERLAFTTTEVEEMSRTASPSTHKRYSVVQICRIWRLTALQGVLAASPQSKTS